MSTILELQFGVQMLAFYALLLFKVFCFVDAVVRPAEAYEATGKLNKAAWSIILGLSAVTPFADPRIFGLLSIAGTVASFVYLLDVRPALKSVTRRR